MERGNTKYEILEAALELFSVQGFEATSIAHLHHNLSSHSWQKDVE